MGDTVKDMNMDVTQARIPICVVANLCGRAPVPRDRKLGSAAILRTTPRLEGDPISGRNQGFRRRRPPATLFCLKARIAHGTLV